MRKIPVSPDRFYINQQKKKRSSFSIVSGGSLRWHVGGVHLAINISCVFYAAYKIHAFQGGFSSKTRDIKDSRTAEIAHFGECYPMKFRIVKSFCALSRVTRSSRDLTQLLFKPVREANRNYQEITR